MSTQTAAPAFNVPTKVSEERVRDLLCCAFGGGSNYWACISHEEYEGERPRYAWEIPFLEDGELTIVDDGAREVVLGKLNRRSLVDGLLRMANQYPKHYANFLAEDEDAETGDVFLQLALMGEIVFG